MTRAITVLLDEQDYDRLSREAQQMGVNPGAAARSLIHSAIQHVERKPTDRPLGSGTGRSPLRASRLGVAGTSPLVAQVKRVRARTARQQRGGMSARTGHPAT
jgi:hypothetical protein